MNEVYESDVCIIGSGAAGATVAAKLARSGLKIHMVEQGRHLGDRDYEDVLGGSEPALVRLENGAWGPHGYPWTTCNVGGGTAFYGAASFRLRRVDFDPDLHLPCAELSGRWPISYDTLRSHYDAIEAELGLSGSSPGHDPTHPGGIDPPLPPVAQSPQARKLSSAARDLGLSPFNTPLLVASRAFKGRGACVFCSPCIEHQCRNGAKFSAFRDILAPLIECGEIELFSTTKAVRLIQEKPGEAAELEAISMNTGERLRFRSRYFILAANAIQTAALMLRSSDSLTHGTASSRDLVGRGLCMKVSEYVVGYPESSQKELDSDDPWRDGVGPFSTVAVSDYYSDPSCPSGLGGLIYEARPGWRYGAAPQDDIARLECLLADTPSRQNRVRLATSKDAHGLPEVIIDYRPHPRDLARLGWLSSKAEVWLRKAGYGHIWREPAGYALGSGHLHGTCRAGEDPETSVVGPTGRLHGVRNVFVADGAYMPFPGAMNPTLTIQAIASYVSDNVRESLSLPACRFTLETT